MMSLVMRPLCRHGLDARKLVVRGSEGLMKKPCQYGREVNMDKAVCELSLYGRSNILDNAADREMVQRANNN